MLFRSGIIDTENGIVHRMPFYEDVKEMPLGEALEQHTGVPVYIQHDISTWAMQRPSAHELTLRKLSFVVCQLLYNFR